MRQLDANQPCPSSTLSKHLVPGGNYRIGAPCSIPSQPIPSHPPVPTCNLFPHSFSRIESSSGLHSAIPSIPCLAFLNSAFFLHKPTTTVPPPPFFTFFSFAFCLLPVDSAVSCGLPYSSSLSEIPYSPTKQLSNRTLRYLSVPFFFLFLLPFLPLLLQCDTCQEASVQSSLERVSE